MRVRVLPWRSERYISPKKREFIGWFTEVEVDREKRIRGAVEEWERGEYTQTIPRWTMPWYNDKGERVIHTFTYPKDAALVEEQHQESLIWLNRNRNRAR